MKSIPQIIARVLGRLAGSRIVSRFAPKVAEIAARGKLLLHKFGFFHNWKIEKVEEITEGGHYLVRIRCTECGQEGSYKS